MCEERGNNRYFDYDVIEKRPENSEQFYYYRLIREQHPHFSITRSTILLQNCETNPDGAISQTNEPFKFGAICETFSRPRSILLSVSIRAAGSGTR